MIKLELYRRSDFYVKFLQEKGIPADNKAIYTCLGEFEHAPDHVLMCEFGTWNLTGMVELCNFEKLSEHPDDMSIEIAGDWEETE